MFNIKIVYMNILIAVAIIALLVILGVKWLFAILAGIIYVGITYFYNKKKKGIQGMAAITTIPFTKKGDSNGNLLAKK